MTEISVFNSSSLNEYALTDCLIFNETLYELNPPIYIKVGLCKMCLLVNKKHTFLI